MDYEQPSFLDDEPPAEDVEVTKAAEAADRLISPDVTDEAAPTFQVPDKARRELEDRKQRYDAEYDRLEKQGMWSTPQIEQKLAQKGLHPLTPTEEQLLQAGQAPEITRGTSSVKGASTGRKSLDRRSLGPQQKLTADEPRTKDKDS